MFPIRGFLEYYFNVDVVFMIELISERSKPLVGRWMENFMLLCMPIYGICALRS